MKKALSLLFFIVVIGKVSAQTTAISYNSLGTSQVIHSGTSINYLYSSKNLSAVEDSTQTKEKTKWYKSKAARISYVPAALFVATAVSWPYREDIRDLRNRFMPNFEDHSDDLVQFIPVALVYGLNAYGIKGEHSLKRATTSLLFSAGICAAVVTTLKYTTNVLRPDESGKNSFPSGHTATAFVTASFLHKEYGKKNPLYSILGYGLAVYTGVFRQLNNKHWISDVFAGAGIGILSTDIGYLISESIFKEREINPKPTNIEFEAERGKPHYLAAKLGFAASTAKVYKDDLLLAEGGFKAGLEGAYFFTNHIGLGAEFSVASIFMNDSRIKESDEFKNSPYISDLRTEPIGNGYIMMGPTFHIDMSDTWFLRLNAFAGIARSATGKIIGQLNDNGQSVAGVDEVDLYQYSPEETFSFGTGLSVEKTLGKNTSLGIYADYHYARPTVNVYEYQFTDQDNSGSVKVDTFEGNLDVVSLGMSFSAMIW